MINNNINSRCIEMILKSDKIDKKTVLLINLPSDSIRKPEEHCGIAFLASYLLSKKIDVQILDAYAEKKDIAYCKIFINNWMSKNTDKQLFCGISPFVTSYNYFVELGAYIKRINRQCYLFAGGHFASLNKEYLIKKHNWLDAIIVGEGEISLYELVINPLNTNIDGVYKRNFELAFSPRRRILNLDSLPYQLRYLDKEKLHGQPYAITTSRGCYGECSFCSISCFYKLNSPKIKQTFRNAKSVSGEIHNLVDKYKIKKLKIVDDNFFRNNSNNFLRELIELISDLDISFRLSARPNDITEERASLLKQLGVVVVAIGVESADTDSLRLFNKGVGIEVSEKAISYLRKNKITCLANFIMFNPMITLEGLNANCEFVEKHIEDCIFHRINSHLWIRSTDPIADILIKEGVCKRKGFPYLECQYRSEEVIKIRKYFDQWCNSNMEEYYECVDILMAQGTQGNDCQYQKYKLMIVKDVEILKTLIVFSLEKKIDTMGEDYIIKCINENNFYIGVNNNIGKLLGQLVTVIVDRPLGTLHPKYKNIYYSINYGYVENLMAPDGEEQDAYIMGVDKPLKKFAGKVIAIIHRKNDVEDKLVVAPIDKEYSKKEIENAVCFQEKFFDYEIEM
ncbi:hypothetical protein B5E64_06150 [Drancourtella sp. An12]|nr:hypothetical protein B5E64_06150 [Drancourtella sp. An12]